MEKENYFPLQCVRSDLLLLYWHLNLPSEEQKTDPALTAHLLILNLEVFFVISNSNEKNNMESKMMTLSVISQKKIPTITCYKTSCGEAMFN